MKMQYNCLVCLKANFMKVLIVDRDRPTSQMIRTKLESEGHTVIEEVVKNNAVELVDQNDIDIVFFDPAPLTNARPVVLGIRRAVRFLYIYLRYVAQADAGRSVRYGMQRSSQKAGEW